MPPVFSQIKKRHRINHSDGIYVRLLYVVPSVIIWFDAHKQTAGPNPGKFGLPFFIKHKGIPCVHIAMITVFVQDCNHISQSFYDSVVNSLQFQQLTCSCGHSACLSVHAYYTRGVKLPSGFLRLRVCRVRCSVCGRTHAVLLSAIVPYSQIDTCDQHAICSLYEQGGRTAGVCDDNPSVDENNVKSVIHNYRRYWRERLRSLRIPLAPVSGLIRSCFANYFVQFMQIHRTPNVLFPYTT